MTPENLEFVVLAAGKSTRNYPHSKGIPHKSLVPFGSRKVKSITFLVPIPAASSNGIGSLNHGVWTSLLVPSSFK